MTTKCSECGNNDVVGFMEEAVGEGIKFTSYLCDKCLKHHINRINTLNT